VMDGPGNFRYDAAFRDFLRIMLSAPPAICARCGRSVATHVRDGFLDQIGDDHYFEDQNLN